MTRRRAPHPGTPPPGLSGAAVPRALPAGPALVYVAPDGTTTAVDEQAVTGTRDRVLCRALLQRAGQVLDDAEAEVAKNPIGFG